jgi:hypothetical protein
MTANGSVSVSDQRVMMARPSSTMRGDAGMAVVIVDPRNPLADDSTSSVAPNCPAQ